MQTFKYSVGDSFVLPFDINAVPLNEESKGKDTINFVLYASNELLVTLQNYIDKNGNIFDNWQVVSFDLSIKKNLEFLEFQQYELLPTTKFGTLGTFVVYGEDDYIIGGITLKSLGSMTFKKPLLINIFKIAEEITTDVESGSVNYQSTLMRIWDTSTKVPLESDKNLLLVVIKDAQKPVKKYAKIEIDVDSNVTNVPDKILPPLYNVVGDSTIYSSSSLVPSATLLGIGLFKPLTIRYDFNAVSFTSMAKPYERSGRLERESVKFSGFGGFNYIVGQNVYIMPEGDYVFPSWKLQTDNTFPSGTGFEETKYSNVLSKILILPEKDKKNRFAELSVSIGGMMNIPKYANDFFLIHPQIFLGGNVKFKENRDDVFLLLGNQPLIGSRSNGGTRAIWNKLIGSTQFPIKTRAQLSKSNKISIEQQVAKNKSDYEYDVKPTLTSTTYFPKSYESFLRVNYPDLFDGKWDIEREKRVELSWKAFNSLGEVDSNMSNDKIEKVLEYFDYANLNEIQSNNPLLYEKLVFLINKSVGIYFKNLPSKQSNSSNTSAKDYFRVDYYTFNVKIKNGLDNRLDLNKIIRFSNKSVVIGFDTYNSEKERKFIDQLNTIADEMQKKAMGIVSSYGHPFLSFEDLEFFKPIFWEQYLIPLDMFIEEENTYLEIDFHNGIRSFASNYFAYTELYSNDGHYLNIVPNLVLRTNEPERWSSLVVSEFNFGGFLDFKVQVDSSSTEQSLKNKALFVRLAMLCIQNIEMLLSLNSLDKLLRLFAYYEVVGKKVSEVSVKDLHHDIRFKYLLLESSIMGIFTEKTIPRLISFITELGNIIQEVKDIYKDNQYKIFNVSFGLLPDVVDWESRDVTPTYIIESFENSFYGKSSQTSVNMAATLLMTYVFEDNLVEKMNMMKENELVGKLITEETTPRAEWLKMFGANSQIDGLPIEEVEDDEDLFDLDSLDVEDIEIDLSADEILEDNIEI